jgi:hypothetical protein
VDRLEHRRNLPHLGRRHVAEDVAVPVHDAALPGGLGEELGGTLGKPQVSGLGVVSVMAAPSRLTWLRLATSKSARFGAASPTHLCERFCTSSRSRNSGPPALPKCAKHSVRHLGDDQIRNARRVIAVHDDRGNADAPAGAGERCGLKGCGWYPLQRAPLHERHARFYRDSKSLTRMFRARILKRALNRSDEQIEQYT